MSEIPLPQGPAKKPAPAQERPGAAILPQPLSLGQFYAEHRALVDARKAHLARVGMLPEHAKALAMPDLAETPVAPPVQTESLPEVNRASGEYEAPPLPRLMGVHPETEE